MLRNLVRVKGVSCLFRGTQSQFHNKISKQLYRSLSTNHSFKAHSDAAESESSNTERRNPFTAGPALSGESADTQKELFLDDEEKAKRLKVLQLEADILYQEGRRVPRLSFFRDDHWKHVLSLPSKSARIRYYGYLWQIEVKKESKERKKVEKAESVLVRKEELRKQREDCDHIIYGLGHTSMFLRFYDSTINHWQNHRLIKAMQFGPKMVVDCSYDRHMTRREATNCAKQLMLCFAENRAHDDPYDLHFCNVDLNSICMKGVHRYIPTMLNPEFPINLHDECFTNIFPKENLVYLTPHCRTDLVEYNPDDVYIIGAMVDTVNNEPLSLAKAKRLGIRMARLPLDRYLQWGSGAGKSLTLNQMVNIMLDIKTTGDWDKSLKHVPRRKIVDMAEEYNRDRRRFNKPAGRLNVQIDRLMSNNDGEDGSEPRRNFNAHRKMNSYNSETWHSNKNRNNFK